MNLSMETFSVTYEIVLPEKELKVWFDFRPTTKSKKHRWWKNMLADSTGIQIANSRLWDMLQDK